MQNIENQVFEPAYRLVRYFGTQDKTAEALNVKQGTVNGWVNGKHGIAAHVAMPVLQVGAQRSNQWLEDILFPHFAEETQCGAAHEFVWVVEIVTDHVADEDHLRQQAAIWSTLLDRFEIEVEQLFQAFILVRHNILDNLHQK